MNSNTETLNQIINDGKKNNIGHLFASIDLNNTHAKINDMELVNFTSCSYLGLERNKNLSEGVINAVKKYGSQYSSSRTFASIDIYQNLEELLSNIFGADTIVTASTTLGHLSSLPILVGKEDLVLLDHQVHASVQQAAQLLKAAGTNISLIPHNNIDFLKSKIRRSKNKYRNIWYLIDGVYSMYGDFAPLKELYNILESEKSFCLYADDAHGMSWSGRNGKGYTLETIPFHNVW